MVSLKLKRILKLFREIGVRLGATTGNDFAEQYPALKAAKIDFPNSLVLKELEGFPEFLAFKENLKEENPVFFVSVIEEDSGADAKIKVLDEFSLNSQIRQILIINSVSNIETAETDELLERVNGFWIRERIKKPLKDLIPCKARVGSRRPQRKKA